METEPSNLRIPVTLLTGFLGSGKTTVLNALLASPAMAGAAVIVNEFGDVGIDHDLVADTGETVVLLQSGCLCCAIRTDLVDTMHDLLERHLTGEIETLDRIIIETTGLADPTPVFHTLMTDQVIAGQFRLDAIVTTIDAAAGIETLALQPEAAKQLAIADRVLLTKTDIVSDERKDETVARIREINTQAPILVPQHGIIDVALITDIAGIDTASKAQAIEAWLGADGFADTLNNHGDIHSACLTIDAPLSLNVLDMWLDALTAQQGADLLRMKGIINAEGKTGPLLVHGVQHVFHPPRQLSEWPSKDQRSRIVLISRKLTKADLDASLSFLRGTAIAAGKGPLSLAVDRKKLLPGLGG